MKYESHYSDEVTTIDDLKRLVKQFASERHWVTSYTPENIALSAALEASKVIECFQGLMSEKSFELKKDPKRSRLSQKRFPTCSLICSIWPCCLTSTFRPNWLRR